MDLGIEARNLNFKNVWKLDLIVINGYRKENTLKRKKPTDGALVRSVCEKATKALLMICHPKKMASLTPKRILLPLAKSLLRSRFCKLFGTHLP